MSETRAPDSPDVRPCSVCGDPVLCDPGYPLDVTIVCRSCTQELRDQAMSLYFAPDGAQIDRDEWATLFEARVEDMAAESWWRKMTQVDDEVEVLTDWLGLAPAVWETLIRGGRFDGHIERYQSRTEAFDCHELIVRTLRAGREPWNG